MLERAAHEHRINLQRSFVVGDRYGDIQLAHNAYARGILVRTGYGEGELAWHAAKWPAAPDFVASDLGQAVDWILRQPK
jgi:D-glycero-D-manno-heptose 1,7-bisphosphate phosphatase